MSAKLAGGCALVTGASGFIGGHLCTALSNAGCRVHGVTRGEPRASTPSLDWYQRDLTDARAVAELVAQVRPDFVFHLASHVMGAPDIAHVLPTFHGNLQSTVNLLTACAAASCERVVLMGSLVEPDDRDGERVPSSPYAASKWASSDYGRMFHRLYGLPVAIARVFMVYGPAQPDGSKLVPNTIGKFRRGEAVTIGNGERLIDWVYVDDVVSGLLAMAEATGIDGDSVDLGSGSLIATRDLALLLKSLMGPNLELSFGRISDRPHEPVRKANVAASFEKIGWRPRIELAEGLRRTIEWYADKTEERA